MRTFKVSSENLFEWSSILRSIAKENGLQSKGYLRDLFEGRCGDRNDIQPVIEILSELIGGDFLLKILIG